MWRQDDLFNVLGAGGNPLLGLAPDRVGAGSGRACRRDPHESLPGDAARRAP